MNLKMNVSHLFKMLSLGVGLGLSVQAGSAAPEQVRSDSNEMSLKPGFAKSGLFLNQPVRKKIIGSGWDQVDHYYDKYDAASFRKKIMQIEQSPFDGVVLNLVGKDDKGALVDTLRHGMRPVAWKKEWFQENLSYLKAAQSPKIAESFLMLAVLPGRADWFDDEAWKNIVNNWRLAAEMAKECNLKGLIFDPEQYVGKQFRYQNQGQNTKYSFEEYQIKVRQRGQELIRALASVNPDLVLMTYWMLSESREASFSPQPQTALKLSYDNLFPAFINGWLDAAPPTMTFIDGCERAYHYNGRDTFLRSANITRANALNLVVPENRRKYKAQVQASFGFYVDAYINPPTAPWYINPQGLTPAQRLHQNLNWALEAADEYVWVYGEKYRWWDTSNPSVKPESWEQAMPGINTAILSANNTSRLAAEREKTGTLKNLLANGSFNSSGDNAKVPAGWTRWQAEKSKGVFSHADDAGRDAASKGAGKLASATDACYLQTVSVTPGNYYLIQGWIKQEGYGLAFIRTQIKGLEDTVLFYDTARAAIATDDNGWQKVQTVIMAPQDSSSIRILLTAKEQSSAQDGAYFDDVAIYQIP